MLRSVVFCCKKCCFCILLAKYNENIHKVKKICGVSAVFFNANKRKTYEGGFRAIKLSLCSYHKKPLQKHTL